MTMTGGHDVQAHERSPGGPPPPTPEPPRLFTRRDRPARRGGVSDMDYQTFVSGKTHYGAQHGFEPIVMPDMLFPFQMAITTWAIQKGRAGIFADCGLGKTFMQLAWAENVARH